MFKFILKNKNKINIKLKYNLFLYKSIISFIRNIKKILLYY